MLVLTLGVVSGLPIDKEVHPDPAPDEAWELGDYAC